MEWLCGNIYTDEYGKYIIDYRFEKFNVKSFITLTYDISEYTNEKEFLNDFKIKDDYYKVVLEGTFHFDVKTLEELLLEKYNNIIRIDNLTKSSIDLAEISNESGIRGVFAKLMMKELNEKPQNSKIIYKAIDHILKQ